MSKAAADTIVTVLRDHATPPGGWKTRTLAAAAGLKREEFHAAIRTLRYSGRMTFDSYALSPSMLAEAAEFAPIETVAVTASTVADEAKIEAEQAGQRRAAARSTGTVVRRGHVDLSAGGIVQDIAIRDDAGTAVSILQHRWPDLWAGIRACAIAQGERPVSTMLRLIEAGLKVEGRSL